MSMRYHEFITRYNNIFATDIFLSIFSLIVHISAGITVVANTAASIAISIGKTKIPAPARAIKIVKIPVATTKNST